jgi:dihydroorotase
VSAAEPAAQASDSPAGSHGADLLVRDARSWPPGPAAAPCAVRIRAGRVVELAATLDPRGEPVHDARGLTLIPGLVDVHEHFRDPGLERKEGWDRGSAGALHGGVTSVVEVQNNPPLSTSLRALEERIAHVRARSRVDFGCLANLLPASVEALDAMAPLTPAFKLFLGGSTGMGGLEDRETLRALFHAAARAGRMIVAHCEDEELLKRGKEAHPDATAAEHHRVRSHEAEERSIDTAIALAEESGAGLHVFHVSTAGGVARIRAARARGLAIGASTAPHYLLLSNEDAPALENLLKVNPSIKTRADSAALLEGLRDGTIEAIGTDHAPHPLDEKRRAYAHAPSGMPSVDLLWPLTFELVRRGLLDAGVALASVTSSAADSLHLPRKGRLAPGHDGDLVLFDPLETRSVRGAELPSASKWSAYEGWSLAGFPRTVVRRGVVAFAEGSAIGAGGGIPLELVPPRPGEAR